MTRPVFVIAASHFDQPISQYFQALASDLASRGWDVIFLADKKLTSTPKIGAYELKFWPSDRPTKIADAVFLWKLLRKAKPNGLVCSFGATNLCLLLGWIHRVPLRIAWVHTLSTQIARDTKKSERHLSLLKWRKKRIYTLASQFVVNSHATADDTCASYEVSTSKIQIHPYLLNDRIDRLNDLNLYISRQPWIVCVGRLDPSKGQDILIQAFAIFVKKNPEFLLKIVGAGPAETSLRYLADKLKISNHVNFMGLQSQSVVHKIINDARVLVCPSYSEALGIVNLEALMHGTPVVASRVGGITDIMTDEVEGFLFKAGDVQELAEKLVRVIQNPDQWEQMSQLARKKFENHFNVGTCIDAHTSWYQNVMNQPSE